MKYSRKKLIEICEKSIVPMERWDDRDSPSAHEKVAQCWMWLKIGCDFKIITEGDLRTDKETVWISIKMPPNFTSIECNVPYEELDNWKTVYLPTEKRLKEADGKDWY